MVFGECPYVDCDESYAEVSPAKTPRFGKTECEKCGREFWVLFSRITPSACTPDELEIDEDTKSIKVKT